MEEKQKEWDFLPSLWIGTMNSYLQVKKFMGPENTEELLKGWTPMSCKGKVQKDKSLVKKPKHVIRGPEEVGPRNRKQPSGSSPSLQKQKSTSKSAQQAQANPKDQPEGQAKVKGKGKAQMERALPAELQDSQGREESHGKCVQYGKKSDGIQKQEERLSQSFPNK
ncbi:hypothetical protein O181_079441 [Austropuccinia psidii MF-1]|uniref:Uncharacterized protein n=1 Tax=Austropuccinia psidii MF-1 TaxID=1389203 RepID=A0A9Q3IDZ1_9BASI|nr:hypothetical protein [Austropuccinia psidii MF-1]